MKRYWRKFRQALDRAIYEGKFKQFAWLGGLLALAFCLTLGLAYITGFNPAESSADGITEEVVKAEDNPSTAMRVLELFLDPGSFVGSHNYGYWLLQLLVVLVDAVLDILDICLDFTVSLSRGFRRRGTPYEECTHGQRTADNGNQHGCFDHHWFIPPFLLRNRVLLLI